MYHEFGYESPTWDGAKLQFSLCQEYSERCLHTIPLKILSVNDPKGC